MNSGQNRLLKKLFRLFAGVKDFEKVLESPSIKDLSDNITPGEYHQGEKPSDFAGIWEEPRDANQIRKDPWGSEN